MVTSNSVGIKVLNGEKTAEPVGYDGVEWFLMVFMLFCFTKEVLNFWYKKSAACLRV